jgi:hypothetical protein
MCHRVRNSVSSNGFENFFYLFSGFSPNFRKKILA